MATFAGQFGPEGIEYPDGGHAARELVTVYELDGLDLAVLYTDRNRVNQSENPLYTDEYGNLTFWAEPGFYMLGVGGNQIAATVPVDPLETLGQVGGEGFTYVQSSPAATWIVANTLGRLPRSVMMIVDGEVVESDYNVTIDTITVTNPFPVAGTLQVA